MGLRTGLSRLAVERLRVLVVEVPGSWELRLATEHALGRRGWCRAASPAESDALVVCGRPGSELSEAIELTWDQLPGPRARADVQDKEDVSAALQAIEATLRDPRPEARTAPEPVSAPDGDMDHDDMAPAGIPLAEGAEDRDELELDVLRFRLGPVLPHWPPGLVLRCVLHGDVIADAVPEVLPAESAASPSALHAARSCDVAADVLALAGWRTAAGAARRITSTLVIDGDHNHTSAAADLARLHRQVARSYLLRWSLRGLGRLAAPQSADHLRGDVHDRLVARLTRARDELGGAQYDDGAVLDVLPQLVTGLDLAAARLVVASLGVDAASLPAVARD